MHHRVLCLHMPRFRVAIELARRPELRGAPLILHSGGERPRAVEACERAEAALVRPGMPLVRALSLCPRAKALPAAEESYQEAHRLLLLAPLLRLTPLVEDASLGLAFASLRGLPYREEDIAKMVHSEVLGTLRAEFAGAGIGPRVAIAGGRFAAEMAARYSGEQICILPPEEEGAFLARLPLAALPQPSAEWVRMRERLQLFGLRTLGDIASLGRVAMQAQFGAVGLAAWRLAAGEPEPLRCLPLPPEAMAQRSFEPPLASLPAIQAALDELAGALAEKLQAGGLTCAALWASWEGEGEEGSMQRLPLKESSASGSTLAQAAWRFLQGAITGPVASLSLVAEALPLQPARQACLFQKRKARAKLQEVVAQVQRRWGGSALCQVQMLHPAHLEERRYAFRPATSGAGSRP